MSDPYIDQFETQIYGAHACEQMESVCLGRVPALDPMVEFAVTTQTKANADMKAVLDKQPKPVATDDANDLLAEARDTLTRFGSYLGSLKGRPVSPRVFFRDEKPSDLGRKRLVKLSALFDHIVSEIPKHPAITDPTWLKDFKSIAKRLATLKAATHGARVERLDLAPEVAAERDRWLATYSANKLLIRGLLNHAGKPELLPLVFDDLAEVHRVSGVSDEPVAPDAPDAGSPTPA